MSSNRGFSLLETLFAIALVTGALLTLAQLVAASVETTATARFRTLAALIAQQTIEQLRSEASLADGAAVQHFDRAGMVVCGATGLCEAAVFTARWSIAPFAAAPATVVIDVAVAHAHRNFGVVRSFAIRPRSVR